MWGKKDKKIEGYNLLTPSIVQKKEISYKLLKEKIKDEKTKNIGITGSYGSGKSSLIESIKLDKDIEKKKYISISLLNFSKEDINKESIQEKTLELEKRILQQIFYQKKSQELPLSKFHKIEIENKFIEYLKIFQLVLFIIASFILKEKYFDMIKLIIKNGGFNKISYIEYICFFIFILWGTFIFYQLVGSIKKLKIKKIAPISSIELSNDSDKEKSTLDLYMEDIIYCFEALKLDLMFIEDLDRCDNIDIFIKLRELNILLNERLENRKVTFVYALRDDLFSDKDRTKFFDFIIPVIPVLNSSNSEGLLREKIKNDFEDEDNEFLSEIFKYITDMRLGLNICNEYKIYREKFLKEHFSSKNLLSIIVYKNIYPQEFSKANFSTGFLYRLFHTTKASLIENKLKEINQNINSFEKDLIEIENRKIKDLKLLNVTFENTIYRKIAEKNNRIIKLEPFEFKESLTVTYKYYYSYNSTWSSDNETINLKDIETILGIDYYREKELIKRNEENEVKKIKEKIQILKKRKNELERTALANLLKKQSKLEKKEVLEVKDKLKEKERNPEEIEYEYNFKLFLFGNGYIDETYGDYLSEFKEGELTKEDNLFIRRVHINDESDTQRKQIISNEIAVFEKLKTVNKYSMLNISLINSCSSDSLNENKNIYYKRFLEFMDLKNLDIREDFLFFLREVEDKEKFVLSLLRNNSLTWNELNEYFETNFINEIIENIINSFSEKGIEELCELTSDQFLESLENQEDIFNLNLNLDKFQFILKTYQIEINNILRTTNTDFFKLIKDNESYVLNKANIENIYFMETKKEIQQNRFYSDLTDTDLINYIDKNIEIFLKNIYFNLGDYSEEQQKLIIILINNKLNNEELIFNLLKLNMKPFIDISSFSTNLWKTLIKDYKIIKTVSNINKYYSEFGLENLVEFLTNWTTEITLDEEIDVDLIDELILEDDISIQIIQNLLENMHSYIYEIDSEIFKRIKSDKIKYLIESKKLSFNKEILDILKASLSEDLRNEYIFNNKATIFELIEKEELDINIFDDLIIIKLIEDCSNIKLITTNLLERDWKIKITEKIIKNIIDIWKLDSIPLLTNQTKFYNFEIFDFLKNLNPNFEKSKVFLKDAHLWNSLATQLKLFNLITIGKPYGNYNMLLIKHSPKISKTLL
ncbi:hypothetical protein NON08_12455 [Cetobacterium somerae]|uniref:YobI family P-loop NTPase n=1 Tax=Cetobacterium sp. NK01 TaxID=2993530 RepID=UPI0021166244|nr:hypothetical protein [Cetobacterium sp. NK01]MCQ8213311.1 hypothetical protein [Cetobacterium sp. NK01]